MGGKQLKMPAKPDEYHVQIRAYVGGENFLWALCVCKCGVGDLAEVVRVDRWPEGSVWATTPLCVSTNSWQNTGTLRLAFS